ncbi:signal peptidase I [Arthrobacter sp.]|uniref:signal peptidase I n=1 Tax=Arthrobacter sp. TaxID=1667 RepID=UPI0033933F75
MTAARIYLVLLLSLSGFALVPTLFGWQASVMQSGSMEPRIHVGDVVLSSSLPDGSPVPVGRVVQFRSPPAAEPDGIAKLRLHRVIAVNQDGTYQTAGDANADADSDPLQRARITGEARLLVPFVGLPGYWLGVHNIPALVYWAALTLAAIAVLVLDWPTPSTGLGNSPSDGQGGATRRVFFALTGAVAVAALTVMPRPKAAAAFSAKTSNVASTWKAGVQAPLTLGRATGYALLASTSITNTGPKGATEITGSIGTSPGASITGLNFNKVSGSVDANTAGARNGQTDALVLYDAAGSRQTTAMFGSTLTGTLTPGAYAPITDGFTVSGILTLDARGDLSAVFIFNASSLTAEANSVVQLINGASANNVYWRIAGPITLGSGSTSAGNYLAATDAALEHESQLTGRLISLAGSITSTRTVVSLP